MNFSKNPIFFVIITLFIAMRAETARSEDIDGTDRKILSKIRQSLQPFANNIERANAISQFVCGSLIRASIYGNQNSKKSIVKHNGVDRLRIQDKNATAIVPTEKGKWDTFSFYVLVTDISHFPSLAQLKGVNIKLIKDYFTLENAERGENKIESVSGIDMNFQFKHGKLEKIEASCDSNE